MTCDLQDLSPPSYNPSSKLLKNETFEIYTSRVTRLTSHVQCARIFGQRLPESTIVEMREVFERINRTILLCLLRRSGLRRERAAASSSSDTPQTAAARGRILASALLSVMLEIPAARDSARAFPLETFPLTAHRSLALFAEIVDERSGILLHRRMLFPGVLLMTVILHSSHASVVVTLVGA